MANDHVRNGHLTGVSVFVAVLPPELARTRGLYVMDEGVLCWFMGFVLQLYPD